MTDTITAPAVATAPAPASAADMQAVQQSSGDAEQFRGAVQWGIDTGKITMEQARKEMEAVGNTLPLAESKNAPAPGPDAGDPSTLPGFEPSPASAFKLPDNASEIHSFLETKDGVAGPQLTASETVAMQKTIGGWFESIQMPADIGNGIARISAEHIKAFPNWLARPESERQEFKIKEKARLETLWGDKTAENIGYARKAVATLVERDENFVRFLGRTGLGDNSRYIAQLAMHGRRLAAKG